MQVREHLLELDEYISRFRDCERVNGYCRECATYGKKWSCPPFADEGPLSGFDLNRYTRIRLEFFEVDSEGDWGMDGFSKVRKSVDARLFEMESSREGAYALLPGTCLLCEKCGRSAGICRHPSAVRPSLEALGFDVAATLEEVFGSRLEWAGEGRIPHSFKLVGALLLP